MKLKEIEWREHSDSLICGFINGEQIVAICKNDRPNSWNIISDEVGYSRDHYGTLDDMKKDAQYIVSKWVLNLIENG